MKERLKKQLSFRVRELLAIPNPYQQYPSKVNTKPNKKPTPKNS